MDRKKLLRMKEKMFGWIKFAREHAKVLVNVSGENFRVQYGDGKWQAIVITGNQKEMGLVMVSEICYGRQRPYAQMRLIGKREKLFSLGSFCKTEKLLPILSEEIRKIVEERTATWKHKTFQKRLTQTYVPKRKGGVTLRENLVEIRQGIVFTLSLLDEELVDFFLKGAYDAKKKVEGLSAKIGILLEKRKKAGMRLKQRLTEKTVELLEEPHSQVFLLPFLLRELVTFGNPKMDREELIYFLQEEKLITPTEVKEIADFWLKDLGRSPKPISILENRQGELRSMLNLDFRIQEWRRKKNYITIYVYPQSGIGGEDG